MIFFNEKFEYLVQNLRHPSIKDMEKYDYDDEKYKTMEWWKSYFEMMLNELGAKGWELIIKYDNSSDKSATGISHTNDELIFKRSSRSKYYKTGLGVDINSVSALAKERAQNNHIN
jgi:hypothetical protein